MRLIDAKKYEDRINAHINAIKTSPVLSSVEANKVLKPWYDALYDLRRMPTVNPYEWINVEDELPERYGKYLVACKEINSPQIRLYEGTWDSITEVTHWMPLPKLP